MLGWTGNIHNRINLRIKILVTTILVVGVFTGVAYYLILAFYTQSELRQAEEYSRSLMDSTYSAMKYPMSVGDKKTIGEQLKDIKAHMRGVEVFVSDDKQDVTYASEDNRIQTGLDRYIRNEKTLTALGDALKTGVSPDGSFMEGDGSNVHLVSVKTLMNDYACFQCHDSKKKVLGAIVVKRPINDVYESVRTARNRLLLFLSIEIVGIILFLNFVIFTLVTRRIRSLARKAGQVSDGDLAVEVHDDSRDSIGPLARHFNQMIKNMRDRMEYANSLKLGISDPFFTVDPDMRLTYVNQAAADLIGMPLEEARNSKSCQDLFRSSVCKTACPVRTALDTGKPNIGQKALVKSAQGKEIPILASSAVLKDSTGKILGGFEILRDLTKEVEAEAALEEARRQEEQAKKDLQEGVEGLSEVLRRVADGDLTVRATRNDGNDAMDGLIQRTNKTLDRMEDLITQTKKAAITVVGGIRHIADQNQSFAQRTQQQAAAMQEISATIEQLISNVRQNTTNTQCADNLSKEAVFVAKAGGVAVEKTIQAMKGMTESSRKIVEMMDLINEITFQTNLLSINAAVEAARAGEQGRGFAVVANEVRNLAKRSSEAGRDIRDLVRDIMERVVSCKDWVGELENGFTKIIDTIKLASDSLSEVYVATQESSVGINQMGQGVREVSAVIEHNAALVDELAEAGEHFNEKATLLRAITEKFIISDQSHFDTEPYRPARVIPMGRKGDFGGSVRCSIAKKVREDLSPGKASEEPPDNFFMEELDKSIEDF